jgi:membrane protease YdiL (CAAX protease family)
MDNEAPARRLSTGNAEPIGSAEGWLRLLAGLALVFALFQAAGELLGSDRGQAGVAIALLVLAALALVERLLFGTPMRHAPQSLGLGRPAWRGIAAGAAVSALLLILIAALGLGRVEPFAMQPGWLLLLPGLFAQAGIAEETLFRGYLFGRLCRGRSFWRAAALSMLPFLAVHLILFATLPWPIALASLALSAVLSFPLAHLYMLGGNTIWAPALLHFVTQGALKLVVIPAEAATTVPILWSGSPHAPRSRCWCSSCRVATDEAQRAALIVR